MDSLVLQRLIASLTDVMDIKLECLKSKSNINLIHERTMRLDDTLSFVFDEIYSALYASGTIRQQEKLHHELMKMLVSMEKDSLSLESLSGPKREALLELARQALAPRHQNDPDAVLLAALEILRRNGK